MSLPAKSRSKILAIGAHPDDIEFGCGGVLLAEAARGQQIVLAICSRGEASSNGTPAEREKEARAAAAMLGATVHFLDLGGDAHMEASAANALTLARCIRSIRPEIVLAPTTCGDQHPDHTVVGAVSRNALRIARYGGLTELRDLPPHGVRHFFAYAITPGAEPPRDCPAVHVDISEYVKPWVRLMECHKSQLRTRDYIELQTARTRLRGVEAGVDHAQALFPSDHLLVKTLAEYPPSIRLF